MYSNDNEITINDTVYRLEEFISKGAFGEVYICSSSKTQEKLAIKIAQFGGKSQSQQVIEIIKQDKHISELIQQQNHENLIKVYEVYESEQFLYIVMEKCDGDLMSLLEDEPQFYQNANFLLDVSVQILEGLKKIHQLKIAHRDLKLENILYKKKQNDQYVFKISDFGTSKQQEYQMLQTIIGTPFYKAPELADSEYYDGFKADLWSFGVLIDEIHHEGNNFYQAKSHAMVQRIVREKKYYIRNPGLMNRKLQQIIPKILIQNPDKRISLDECYQILEIDQYKLNMQNQLESQLQQDANDPHFELNNKTIQNKNQYDIDIDIDISCDDSSISDLDIDM